MSLMAAGVPIKKMVAGISCGLVTGDTDDDFVLLTDIQGLEDFFGDMDFKVAGTQKGITAIQMDIKIKGISEEIMHTAINQANEGRQVILAKMLECVPEVAPQLSVYAPKIISFEIDPDKIGDVIGKQGCVIKKIMEETSTQIEFNEDDSGRGYVSCVGPIENALKAKSIILNIAHDPEIGDMFVGTVVRILFTFQDLAGQGNQSAAVASGIASALIATAFGLGVAIVAVIFYNSFQSIVKRYEDDFQLIKLLFLSFVDSNDESTTPSNANISL